MIDALLVYPRLGSMDSMVVDLPLSVIYAASDSVKRGYRVELLDLRLHSGDWRPLLDKYLAEGVRLFGVSVMTGRPLVNAREITTYVRERSPTTKTVWGGPHVTVLPETLEEPYLDYLVRGYGSAALADLIAAVRGEGGLSHIQGLSYHDDAGQSIHSPRATEFENIHYLDIPYQLIDVNAPGYMRTYSTHRMFPIFTSIGCPYQCSFCVHPAIYKVINGKKWKPLPEEDVIDHIEFVKEKYQANHIVFIDDTSFPRLDRMKSLFERLIERRTNVTLEFRGARINEIEKMDDEFIDLMIRAGGRVLLAGVESGSNKILRSFQKGITREQVIAANRKLARYPQLTVHYNFIYGTPGETYEDLLETKKLVEQILRDNPQAYFGFGGDWKPIPGTKMLEIAETEFGYRAPKTLEEWVQIDSADAEKKISHNWYSRQQDDLIKLMQVACWVIDDKLIKESKGNNSPLMILIRTMARLYKPIAQFRFKFNFHSFMIEHDMFLLAMRILPRLRRFG